MITIILRLTLLYRLVLSEIDRFPRVIEESCLLQPLQCNLLCTNGYKRLTNNSCICACAENPCESKLCAVGEYCIITFGGVPRCVQNFAGNFCCSNGCGRECGISLPIGIVVNKNTPIQPINGNLSHNNLITAVSLQATRSEIIKAISNTTIFPPALNIDKSSRILIRSQLNVKVGQCPPYGNERICATYRKCSHDDECDDVMKCCMNACGKVCVDPTLATNCIHLFVAMKKLTNQAFNNGYKPECDENGKFTPVQCDLRQCWCVDVNYGTEIAGSAVMISMRRNDMCRERRQCGVTCSTKCTHGLKMSIFGCPDPTCECRNMCEGIRCGNHAHTCQLVEPDCANPPCLPVPTCLLNPCPNGKVKTHHNGVSTFCTTSEQCGNGYWCHKIGYDGLGFCCSGQEVLKRGICPVVKPLKDTRCSSTCSTDYDCGYGMMCCFDGCGLSCYPLNRLKLPHKSIIFDRKLLLQPPYVLQHNKGMISSLVADCPSSLDNSPVKESINCTSTCHFDDECYGLKRCCRIGCSTKCVYPIRTTRCLNSAITAELYGIHNVKRCDRSGKFESIQCDNNSCVCVDVESGEDIPGTRTTSYDALNCKEIEKLNCPDMICRTSCPYEYERDEYGCKLCRCRNPCTEVNCPEGTLCIMTSVNCFEDDNCPPQPRCVLNFCPHGKPFISQIGVVETCNSNEQCPSEYWCHQVGYASSGLCCPSPSRVQHIGVCPSTYPNIDRFNDCRFDCRSDDDCKTEEKCCYDGCGLHCREVKRNGTGKLKMVKPGVCPNFEKKSCTESSRNIECVSDDDCNGIQKCCSIGCNTKCLYPQNISICMQMKSALQMIGQSSTVLCRPDGSFEEVQCDAKHCWCVNQFGVEVEGTRSSDDVLPNCRTPRKCRILLCPQDISCKFGMKKDSNGCDTCECSSPCDRVVCPDTTVCVPTKVNCDVELCPEVPKCVVNPCLFSSPLLNASTAQPLKCSTNDECGTNVTAYCTHYKGDSGVCCPGSTEPRWSPGRCPPASSSNSDCSRNCILDIQCPSGQKCCFNGCGLSCVAAVLSAPHSPAVHIGECLKTQSLGAFCTQRSIESECSVDTDCPPFRKCCSDGCTRRCTVPEVTTHCIHAHLSALTIREFDNSVFVPECDIHGEYVRVQSHYGSKWCVDKHGREIPGTKSLVQPHCDLPKSCPVRSCDKHCPNGFRSDNDGCPICDCISPCQLVKCGAGFICKMVQPKCYTEDCAPIHRCIPNTCPYGEPLIYWTNHGTEQLVECNERTICPAGFFCSRNGYENRNFCCRGTEPSISLRLTCPPTPLTANAVDSSSCIVACRRVNDCRHSTCCFNGCGMSCQFQRVTSSPMSVRTKTLGVQPLLRKLPIHPIDSKRLRESIDADLLSAAVDQHLSVDFSKKQKKTPVTPSTLPITMAFDQKGSTPSVKKLGICPTAVLNPGCREECRSDEDCVALAKCCKATCGTKCMDPAITSPCMHRLIAFVRQHPLLSPPVQCDLNGDFRQIQCDNSIKQCWCVNRYGIEEIGTRTNNEQGVMPRCRHPKMCPVSCAQLNCSYGILVDSNGCPRNDVCQCKNPCQDFICPTHMTCSMIFVQCDRSPCPMVTRCVPTVCEYNRLVQDLHGNALSCQSGRCLRGECVMVMNNENGVCCDSLENVNISTSLVNAPNSSITDDVSSPYFDEVDDFIGMYELGFSLTGPQILPSTRRQAELALGHFLSERFFIPISSINEVIIMNDNTVRFIVKHAKANVIAKNISEAVTSGLEINLNGNYYRAEPHTWFSHQIVEAESLKTAKAIFWALCSIVIVIAVIIFITLCGTCASMYRSASNTTENSTEYIASQLDFATQSTPRDRSQRCQQPYPRHNDSSHLPSRSTQIRLAQSIPEIPLISIDRQFVPHLRSM